MLKSMEESLTTLSIRNIQITYVSDNLDIVKKLIPFYVSHPYTFDEVLEYIRKSNQEYYRINYILIQGVNDSIEAFERFRDKLLDVRNKVIVRISKLNETKATQRNLLNPAAIETMDAFRKLLHESGIRSYVFYSKKNDNMNCGQLITERD